MRGNSAIVLVCLEFILLSGGCVRSSGPAVTSVDSAGTQVIHYASGAIGWVPVWSVSGLPDIRIGTVHGDPGDAFVWITAALRQKDGDLLVLDRGLKELRLYSPTGQFLFSQGRRGSGPGEFLNPTALWRLPGDSLAVFDQMAGRISVLDQNLAFVRSFRARPFQNILPGGALTDGRFLLIQPRADLAHLGQATYWIASKSGLDSLGSFRLWENASVEAPGQIPDVPIWTQFRHSAAAGDLIFSTRNGSHELEIWDLECEPRTITRWQDRDLDVDRATVDRWLERQIGERSPELRPAYRRSLERQPVNRTYPAFSELLSDSEGNAWLQSWIRPGDEDEPTQWTVVSPEGRLVGKTFLPPDFVPLEIGREYVLGRQTDELGVQSLSVFRLLREKDAGPQRGNR